MKLITIKFLCIWFDWWFLHYAGGGGRRSGKEEKIEKKIFFLLNTNANLDEGRPYTASSSFKGTKNIIREWKDLFKPGIRTRNISRYHQEEQNVITQSHRWFCTIWTPWNHRTIFDVLEAIFAIIEQIADCLFLYSWSAFPFPFPYLVSRDKFSYRSILDESIRSGVESLAGDRDRWPRSLANKSSARVILIDFWGRQKKKKIAN